MSHSLTRRFASGAAPSAFLRRVLAALAFALLVATSHAASAYPWMIRDAYSTCQSCHVDPAGSGILNQYGRSLGEIRLATPWTEKSGEATSAGNFLFGAFDVPAPVLLGGQVRYMYLTQKVTDVDARNEGIWMQLDFAAAVQTERFVASATLGYAPEGALDATLTRGESQNLASREHWLGVYVRPSTLLLRAGRMNLPFGIRSIEHTMWTRALTHTSINDDQQHGIAFSFEYPEVRGEIMAILGNYQIRPDEYRERGYSGYVEVALDPRLAVGASSLLTHRELDPRYLNKTFRQAHGVMARWATPYEPLVLLTEWDYALESPRWGQWRQGVVGYLQADYEPTQGFHLFLTGEMNNFGRESTPFAYGAWLSPAWFFATHADVRIDGIYQSMPAGPERVDVFALLLQTHLYL